MNFDQDNAVVKLCSRGMELEASDPSAALALFNQALEIASDDFEKFTVAHYLARHQKDVEGKLKWDQIALMHALNMGEQAVGDVLPSLYLNIGKCYEDLNDPGLALQNYIIAESYMQHLPEDGYGSMIRSGIIAGIDRVSNKSQEDNYQSITRIQADGSTIYRCLTADIQNWWSEQYEGVGDEEGGIFTVRFGDSIYKTFEVAELQPNRKVVWLVKDSLIDIPELKNKTEWIGTTIDWEIEDRNGSTLLKLTHIGLNPHIECYDICQAGWVQFLSSLKAFAETGKGTPFKA